MRSEQLYYFLETVKTGSFSQAANNLYLQQPSLRQQIIQLEQELGKELFIRSNKGVFLTEYGKQCLPYIQQIIDIYEMMKYQALPSANSPKALNIESIDTLNLAIDFAMLDELYCKTVKGGCCRISLNDNYQKIIANVVQGTVDIGLIIYYNEELSTNEYLKATLNKQYKLYEIKTINNAVCMRKDHPLAHKQELFFEELSEYLIIFQSMSNLSLINLLSQYLPGKKINYTIISNLKLIYKYCLQENSLFFMTEKNTGFLEDGLTYRLLNQKYQRKIAIVVKNNEISEEILKCIDIIRIMFQNCAF